MQVVEYCIRIPLGNKHNEQDIDPEKKVPWVLMVCSELYSTGTGLIHQYGGWVGGGGGCKIDAQSIWVMSLDAW